MSPLRILLAVAGSGRLRAWVRVAAICAVTWSLAGAVEAQDGRPPIDLFTSVSRTTAAVGDLITLEVEALTASGDVAAQEALIRAVGTAEVGTDALALVRADSVVVRRIDGVTEVQRRFYLRATAPGVHALPPIELAGRRDEDTAARTPQTIAVAASQDRARWAGQSVLSVTVELSGEGERYRRIGSAFVGGAGLLVTAYHVIVGAEAVTVRLPDGEVLPVREAVVLDPARDVAVLQVPEERLHGITPLPLAPRFAETEVAYTAGWPHGEQRFTEGRRYDDLQVGRYQLRMSSNAVEPGDSGGPLLDVHGRVLGLVMSGRAVDRSSDLLTESVTFAADPSPALEKARSRSEGRPLREALRDAADQLPPARAHAAAGAFQMHRNDGAAWLDRLQRAAAEAPGDPLVQYLCGTVLEAAGREDRAQSAYGDAREAGYFPAAYALAYHHLRMGDADLAASLFAEVHRVPAYRHLGAFGLAQANVMRLRYDEAAVALREVLTYDSRFAPALYLLGITHLAAGRTDRARALAVRLRSRPGWASALTQSLGNPLMRPVTLERLPRVENVEAWASAE